MFFEKYVLLGVNKVRTSKNNIKSKKKGFSAFISSLFSRKDKKIDFNVISNAFQDMRMEFDDHRETINHNTNEIQANYEYLSKLDLKMQKMDEKMDEFMLMMQQARSNPVYSNIGANAENFGDDFENINLTSREKEVFLTIYTSDDNITYKEIAKRTGLTTNLVSCYVQNLVSKGVPLGKNYSRGAEVALEMDPLFKEMQARRNIVGINERITKH